jgi:hypothetical protein
MEFLDPRFMIIMGGFGVPKSNKKTYQQSTQDFLLMETSRCDSFKGGGSRLNRMEG